MPWNRQAGNAVSRQRLLGATAATFASIGMVREAAKPAQFELKCGWDLPADHPVSTRIFQLWKMVET